MNEISVFEIAENTAPRDLHHIDGLEEREVHNISGHLMISATFGGLLKRDPNQNSRPFILTRSFFAGLQRSAFTWSGDNTANWLHLQNSIPQVLSYGVSSMVYSGADIGGFHDSKLLSRWYQVGTWLYPFFRCHCHEREIYMLEGEPRAVARDAIFDRYRLLQYWYTLARAAPISKHLKNWAFKVQLWQHLTCKE